MTEREQNSPMSQAFEFGRKLGSEHPRLHDSGERVGDQYTAQVRAFTTSLASQLFGPARGWDRVIFWSPWAIIIVLGMISNETEGATTTVLVVISVIIFAFWAFLAIGSLMQWSSRDANREAVAGELANEVFRGFFSAIGERQDASVERGSIGHLEAPLPHELGVSPEGAETLACQWMRHLGAEDAEVTRYSGDGGVDVRATGLVAQVKHYTGTVGVVSVRELFGVATAEGARPIFFTSTGYTREAVTFADRVDMPLFVYSAEAGSLDGANGAGEQAASTGLR